METPDRGQATLVELLQLAGNIKIWYQGGDFDLILLITRRVLKTHKVPDPTELEFRPFMYQCLKLASPVPVHLLNNLICFLFCNVVN